MRLESCVIEDKLITSEIGVGGPSIPTFLLLLTQDFLLHTPFTFPRKSGHNLDPLSVGIYSILIFKCSDDSKEIFLFFWSPCLRSSTVDARDITID